jgi:tetratricopeptide (TPR) repeat protein
VLDAATAATRAAVLLKPDVPEAHFDSGFALASQGKLAEAIAEYRTALRLKPDYAEAHNNFSDALRHQGRLPEAIAKLRSALRLKPDYAEAHNDLGGALYLQGKLEEAVAELRSALRLKPDYAEAHYSLGIALGNQGKRAEAIAEYRTAVRLKPDYAEAHINLGSVLLQEGLFAEALAEFRRGHELGSKRPNWRAPSAQWVREAERMVDLEQKLPAIVTGKTRPADAAESLAVAQMFYNKKLHGASAQFWQDAFQTQPALADDMKVQNRYNAACAAALAGCGQGKDDPPLDAAAKARWRTQALDWLKADLAAWAPVLKGGTPQARQPVAATLQHWKVDPDLAGLRDKAALAKLPEDEQRACRALWAEVDALLSKAQSGTKP